MRYKNLLLNKWYFIPQLLSLGTILVFVRSKKEILVILGIFSGVLLNHYFLTEGISALLSPGRKEGIKIFIFFLGKFLVLVGALSLGVHFMGDRIIIGLVLYILQIAALCATFAKIRVF